jgi:hypothetical protein
MQVPPTIVTLQRKEEREKQKRREQQLALTVFRFTGYIMSNEMRRLL